MRGGIQRRGGLCWVVGLLVLLSSSMLQPRSAPAASTAIQLVPMLMEATRTTAAQGVFYRHQFDITIATTPILMASSPDGTGDLCTDDQATFTFRSPIDNTTVYTWQHQFASADRRTIQCLPPQDISAALVPGNYEVEIVLNDLYPPDYGTRAYYLVMPAANVPSPTVVPSSTTLPTTPPTPTALRTSPTATPTPVASTIVGDTIEPTLGPPIEPDTRSDMPDAPHDQLGRGHWLLIALTLLGVGSGGLLVVWRVWRQRPQVSAMHGAVDLFDSDTHEARTVLLAPYTQGAAITRHPLALVARTVVPQTDTVIGWITAAPQGIQLHVEPITTTDPVVLHPDDQTVYPLAAGRVTLHYRRL